MSIGSAASDRAPGIPEMPLEMPGDGPRSFWRFAGRHKITSGVVVVFIAAIIAVSLLTTGGSAPKVYKNAPPFTVSALGRSGQVSLSQYAGKPVIVNFFASWCYPCQQETPLIASWYKQQDGKVALVGLDENDVAASAEKFTAAKGVTYPTGFDPTMIVARAYSVDALPQTLFLNARHQIVEHLYGAVTQAELTAGMALMNAS